MQLTLSGILVGAVLPLVGYFVFHWLAKLRDGQSRFANACNDFRNEVIRATRSAPRDAGWSNDVLQGMPETLRRVGVAVEIFRYFLNRRDKATLDSLWTEFSELVESHIPKAHSTEQVMYGGGQVTAAESRGRFHTLIDDMLKLAKTK